MAGTIVSPVQTLLRDFAESFSRRVERLTTAEKQVPARLREAVRYSLLAPGKRLRPYLVTRCCVLSGGDESAAFAPAAALEMVHVYSLIHDDLPAMDDDDLRRGLPTNHKVFGEALAILAGDALLTLAFETLAHLVEDGRRAAALVGELAAAAGWTGMIAGQAADILGEQEAPQADLVGYIHERKTAALFRAAGRMGAVAAGAPDGLVERFGQYGRHLGLAFQIADDLLDVTASATEMGKAVGKDAGRHKQTYAACVGIERSRELAAAAAGQAVEALHQCGPEAEDLREIARFAVARSR